MYPSEALLTKLNADPSAEPLTLADLMSLSLTQLQVLVKTRLTPAETVALFERAQLARKDNTVFESRLLARNNPQLTNLTRLDVAPLPETRDYTEMFAPRSHNYVAPGSVSSMFSPAAYLTELYREAAPLHPETSQYNLKKRRPDLGKLLLSQTNMDEEVSTLSLSNDILMDTIATHQDWTPEKVMETLSTYRLTGDTPCHMPYKAIRQCILQRDPPLSMFAHSPYFSAKLNPQFLTALEMTVPPELMAILTEEVTEKNAEALFVKNFGNLTIEYLSSVNNLANYYDLSTNEVVTLISTISASSTYLNNNLNTITVNGDNVVDYYNISVEEATNAYQLNYAYLTPLMGEMFEFDFSTTDTRPTCSRLVIENSNYKPDYIYFVQKNLVPQKNKNTQVSFSIPRSHISSGFLTINVIRQAPVTGGFYNAGMKFTVNTRSFKSALLLNKFVRLYKASGLSLSEMERVLLHADGGVGLDTQTLTTLAQAMFLSRQHGISLDDALVLSGTDIGMQSTESLASQFDLLFNTPPLNGQTYTADGTVIEVHPDKLPPSDSFRRAVLKRAWQVDDAGLYAMHLIGNRTSTTGITNTLTTLSALHRIALLAQTHGLNIDELNTLLLLSPYRKTNLYGVDNDTLKALTQYLFFVTEWLGEQRWSVYQLFVMVTDTYATVWTPSLDALQQTLLNGLGDQSDLQGDELVTAMAPFIASSLKLNTSNLADSALRWANHIKPAGQTTDSFWPLIQKTDPSDPERNNIIAFAQTLAQLSLIINSVNISEQELSLLVSNPGLLTVENTSLELDVDTLQQLTQFHNWINGTGDYINSVLTALNAGSLDVALLARAIGKEVSLVGQAVANAVPGVSTLKSWSEVTVAQQWLDLADRLNLTPDGVADLMSLDYAATPYATWVTLADMLLGALDPQQHDTVNDCLSEVQSAALSAYYICEVSPVYLANRDALYSHLLIDNRISAQVKTSRLAEAITSLQLYVYRTLSDQDADSDTVVTSRQFFLDWDTYNARYSTWAGVSQLVYYPENYVDPTIRVGKTQMMDDLLQDISQSNLNAGMVEEMFKSYLTKFEDVANLKILSGYVDDHQQKKYQFNFIGKDLSSTGKYYWRSLDGELKVSEVYPSNAWGEWLPIPLAINPESDLIQPVVYKSRLHIVWVEKEVKDNQETTNNHFYLKLSYITYDGTWASPYVYNVTDLMDKLSLTSSPDKIGLFCSNYYDEDAIIFILHKKDFSYTENYTSAVGGKLQYMSMMEISEQTLLDIIKLKYPQLDTPGKIKLKGSTSQVSEVQIDSKEVTTNNNYTLTSEINNVTISSLEDGRNSILFDVDFKVEFKAVMRDFDKRLFDEGQGAFAYIIGDTIAHYNDAIFSSNTTEFTFVTASYPIYEILFAFDKDNGVINTNDVLYLDIVFDGVNFSKESPRGIIIGNLLTFGYQITTVKTKNLESLRIKNKSGTLDCTVTIDEKKRTLITREYIFYEHGDKPHLTNISNFSVISPSNMTMRRLLTGGDSTSPEKKFNYFYSFKYKGIELILDEKWSDYEIVCENSLWNPSAGHGMIAHTLRIIKTQSLPIGDIARSENGALYLQEDCYRYRLNTLFAGQLISRASNGINEILSMDSQLIPEPQMGNGGYIKIIIPQYDESKHGSSRNALVRIDSLDDKLATFWQGQLQDTEQEITLFVPLSRTEAPFYDNINFPGNLAQGLDVELKVDKGRQKAGNLKTEIRDDHIFITSYTPERKPSMTVYLLSDTTEPMDFSGANALYFWEMFYYTPMMVFARLLQESQFDEALTWLKYVWNPAGYVVNGSKQPYDWNCRPLQEDTSWNADPLDTVDPDAVAQRDPMHYKVATFMRMLDLLLARGDAAYRRLERGTLNEAKMWYQQALSLLGNEPYVPLNGGWDEPSLETAANKTAQDTYQQALLTLREEGMPTPLTANSLTALFLPEVNGKLQGYWQILAQRLYNLRHNLSIDGQPLSLPLHAPPASPEALHSAAVATSQGGGTLPPAVMPLYRFPVILDSARSLAGQLTQFGASLLNLIERQDGEAMAELLQTQARDLMVTSLALQDSAIAEVEADEAVLNAGREGTQRRLTTYAALYDENINSGEKQAMELYLSASVVAASGDALRTTAAAMDLVPNIYGMAVGGTVFGAAFNAMAISTEIASQATRISADRISFNETYRRRREEWAVQRDNAQDELKQIEAQLVSLGIRREAAELQKTYLKTQQAQVQAQLEFLQRKFSNKALYNWLRGCLSAIYHQFYDLTVSRCLMSQEAYRWEMNKPEASFIKPGAWNSTHAGLMAGENLVLNLTQMENAYLKQDERPLEVTRTASLAQLYAGLPEGKDFVLADGVKTLLDSGSGQAGTDVNGLKLVNNTLASTVKLGDLSIMADYPDNLGKVRRIKQISVTLPMLMGPYQDVQAVLSYGGSVAMPRGCDSLAVSHGMNDSGQFQLDFNDVRYLPFEGIPVNDTGTLTLSFPNATGKQETLLLSLSDIILHIRYTIRH